jgi:hypothetical protein
MPHYGGEGYSTFTKIIVASVCASVLAEDTVYNVYELSGGSMSSLSLA